MAKKEETISLIDTFSEFKELKNIDRTTMVSVLEESFRSVIAKMFEIGRASCRERVSSPV